MAAATFQVPSFLGGEWSKAAQGRIDRPDYRYALNVCVNAQITEQGDWRKRSGTMFAGHTRGGLPGRLISFNFKQSSPYLIEATAGYFRFRQSATLITTNDQQAVVAISAANPAVVQVASAWPTGSTVMFNSLGTNNPLLQNRQFTITNVDGTHFSLQDAITGANIDGSTLGTFVSGNVVRILEIATPYTTSLWKNLRSVQCDVPLTNSTTPGTVLLHPQIKPQVLEVATAPTPTANATFTFGPAVFKDGPYFDPVPGGTLATPSALNGNITITLSFNAYDATRSYSVGDYVTSAGVNYKSLVDANLNNTPVSSPSDWATVNSSDAIGPNGFQGSDIGRHIRLFSEPALWDVGTAYVVGNVVTYAGADNKAVPTYWICISASTGNIPPANPTKWVIATDATRWTWGRITALSTIIDRALAGSAPIGNMTLNGGLAASFDGVFSKNQATSSAASTSGTIFGAGLTTLSYASYVGKNYSGASAQKIAQAVIYPSTDLGLAYVTFNSYLLVPQTAWTVTLNLRAKHTLPANSSDGTLLGNVFLSANTTAPVTLVSSDQTTAWEYVWVEIIGNYTIGTFAGGAGYTTERYSAQVSFFGPPGTGTGQGVTVQIVGDPLLYTTAINTWRLGLYSDTTGWPTCGTYHEGRLWLAGVIGNRIDSSVSNDIFNFAPTNADGSVSSDRGISYVFNAPDVNPIFWMEPDALGIVCGTQAGEWVVQATQQNLPLSPTTIQAHRHSTNQCANIEPRRTELTLAVVQSYKRELLEYFADVFSGKFTAQDLTWSAKHLTTSGIQEIVYQQELAATIWSRMGDGSFTGITYKRKTNMSSQEPEMRAWHRHTSAGGHLVESIALCTTQDGLLPTLALISLDPNSQTRHVEVLSKMPEEGDAIGSQWLLDHGINPTSVSSSSTPVTNAPYGGLTVNGLWFLNGQTVQATANGFDCGNRGGTPGNEMFTDFFVTNGSLFIPYADGVSAGPCAGKFTQAFAAGLSLSQIIVGVTYTSQGQIVRPSTPAESGSRNGPPFGKIRREHWNIIQVVNTAGLSWGTNFSNLLPILFKDASGAPLAAGSTFTGVYRDPINADYDLDGMICWQSTRPQPAIVAAIGGAIHTQDI